MKYPQSVPMPRDVEDWLEGELEARGINAVVYTRYILSVLQHNSSHNWPLLPSGDRVWSCQKKEVGTLDSWQKVDDDAVKRLAVVRCLMAASSQNFDIESLVDELCAKLKEFESCTTDGKSAFTKRPKTPLYAPGYYTELQSLREALAPPATSVLTRGILRASLDHNCTALPNDDTINAQDCFSLMYCGSDDIYGSMGDLLSEQSPKREDVGRLYERATDHSLDRFISKFHANVEDIWRTNSKLTNLEKSAMAKDECYILNCYNLFSPTLFLNPLGNEELCEPGTVWSLGGANPQIQIGGVHCNTSLKPPQEKKENVVEPPPLVLNEEDLLTSAKTHFRPIRSDDSGGFPPHYADGTTFAISTELEQLPFKRTESGSLFLYTGKYMEFKCEEIGDDDPSEFVPKFRVRQSNEKCCQTDENDFNADINSVAADDSSESSVSEADEFYFPGDDALALDINAPDLPIEEELIEIVDRKWQPLANKLPESLQDPDPEVVHLTSVDPAWEANGVALVENIVNDDFCWTSGPQARKSELRCAQNENVINALQKWPPVFTWNLVEEESENNSELKADNSSKNWREIWGIKSLRESGSFDKSWDLALNKSEIGSNYTDSTDINSNSINSNLWADENTSNQEVDWSCFGPISVDKNVWEANDKESTLNCRWPKLGPALSAYLEESRVRAFQLLDGWRPIESLEGTNLINKQKEWRELWSPCNIGGENITHFPDDEWREIWSPVIGSRPRITDNLRASNYVQLRDELLEDGDQLLLDIQLLHLQRITCGDLASIYEVLESDCYPPIDAGSDVVFIPTPLCQLSEASVNCLKHSDRPYNRETAQKERKRRNSSSQKICDQYMEGECRRPHCRFLHCDAAIPCPFFDDASCLKGDACPLSHSFRAVRQSQRAFTL